MKGKKKFNDGYLTGCYNGNLVWGKAHGKGKFTFSRGGVYEGEFSKDDIKHGPGKYTNANGDVYEGELINRGYMGFVIDGFGKFTGANGVVQDGYWFEGKFLGEGQQGKLKMAAEQEAYWKARELQDRVCP